MDPRYSQPQSNFLRLLPQELRCQIYTYVCGARSRHVFVEESKLRTSPCLVLHDDPVDDCQIKLAAMFRSGPAVQRHSNWYDRLTSEWCNHWRCEEAMRDTIACSAPVTPLSLLLSCKRIYEEASPIFYQGLTITVAGRDAADALLRRTTNPAFHRGRELLSHAVTLNISLRHGAADFLFINGPCIWLALSSARLPRLKNICLWVDGCEPVSRRLYPVFRYIWEKIPDDVAGRLTVSFPCGGDGFWAWDEVRGKNGKHLPKFSPRFQVIARGWEQFTATSAGFISHNARTGLGGPGGRFDVEYNPFEQMYLYGRGYFDSRYP